MTTGAGLKLQGICHESQEPSDYIKHIFPFIRFIFLINKYIKEMYMSLYSDRSHQVNLYNFII